MTKKEKITDQISRMDRIIGWVKVCDDKTSILLSVALLVPTVTIGTASWRRYKVCFLSLLVHARSMEKGITSLFPISSLSYY